MLLVAQALLRPHLTTGAIVWDNLGMLCLGWPGFLMLGPELETLVRVDLGWTWGGLKLWLHHLLTMQPVT